MQFMILRGDKINGFWFVGVWRCLIKLIFLRSIKLCSEYVIANISTLVYVRVFTRVEFGFFFLGVVQPE